MNPTDRRRIRTVTLTRKQVLKALAGFAVLGACGPSDGNGDGDTQNRCSGSSISANHGHAVVLTAADLAGTQQATFSIQGTSSHDHTITLSAAQLSTLAGGGSVQVSSSEDASHFHEVSVNCT